MQVVVIGAGYVGLVAAACLADSGHRVTCVEANQDKLALLHEGLSPIREAGLDTLLATSRLNGTLRFTDRIPVPLDADIVFIAVGTPSNETGGTDLSQVSVAAAQIAEAVDHPVVVAMKSTVPPGTGLRLERRHFRGCPVHYVSNPEFLREGQAVWDWRNPSRIVIGSSSPEAARVVGQLYADTDAPVMITDVTSAEAIKYAANAFLVTKISFINEIASLCDVVGAHIDDVARGIGLDPRIGPDFLRAGLGYGGSCFPKDARGLDFSALNNGYDFRLLKSTIEVNTKQRIQAVRKLKRMVGDLEGVEVGLLGLAFKPETDDIRESPALAIARLLHDEGCRLRVCDPAAAMNAVPYLPAGATLCDNVYEAADGARAVMLVTEWREFIDADWSAIRASMQPPYAVLDGRNALQQDELVGLGFTYSGIGRNISRPLVTLA
jgi:UDPglucose 6-dehydrogenase